MFTLPNGKTNRGVALTIAAAVTSTAIFASPLAAQTDARTEERTPRAFECEPGFYQVIAGQLAELDPVGDAYDLIGANESSYNAMGYRLADGLLYAIRGTDLLRIDADGVVDTLAELDIPAGAYTGDFGDDGLLHVSRGGRDWYAIDVDAGTVVSIPELSGSYGVADITNVYGKFYGLGSAGDLVRFDPDERTVTVVGAVTGLPDGAAAFGAAWSTIGGNLYVGRNSGEIFQVTGYSSASPTATQVANAPSTNSNDGASCSLAAAPAGIVDVDGPTPETEPSTPEAKEAAKSYEEQEERTYTFPSSGTPDGPSCAMGIDEDRPPRMLVSAEGVASPTVVYSSGDVPQLSDFDVLSGLWTESSDALQQTHDCGYDYTALLGAEPLLDYRWEATVSGESAKNRGGVIINQSNPLTRSGATIIDIAENRDGSDGTIVRWGAYDDRGYYQMIGSSLIALSNATATFEVEVHDSTVTAWVDGVLIATFEAPNAGGHVGLVTSRAAASFGQFTLTALPATIDGEA